jgi:hypothetical protein
LAMKKLASAKDQATRSLSQRKSLDRSKHR